MKTTLKIALALFALATAYTAASAMPQGGHLDAKTFFEQQTQWGS